MIRAMTTQWSLLWILALVCSSDSSCSPTSYYKSCWIRRFPGLYVDTEESQRRGAHVLKVYQEETALKCSRACCLTPNFSCTLAVFHFNTTQDSVNCFHLQCPTLESCIPHHRGNVILYNVTKGVDPDLLVFGKYFTANVRVLPHMSSSRLNVSEPLTSDKRHFNYPPNPPVRSTSAKTPTTPVPTTHQVQHTLPRCTTIPATTAQRTPSPTAQMNEPETTADTLNQSIPNSSSVYTTRPDTSSDFPIKETPSSSTTQQNLGLHGTTSLVTASQFFTKFLTSTQTTEQATSQSKPTSITLQEHPQTSVPMTVSKTYTSTSANVALETSTQITSGYQTVQATSAQSMSTKTDGSQQTTKLFTSTNVPLELTSAYTTIQVTTAQTTSEHVTPSKTDSTFNPQGTISTTSTPITPEYKTSTWTPTPSQPKETTSSDTGTLRISTTTPRYLTHTRMGNTVTTGSLSSSLTAPTSSMVESQPYPNDTKGYISRNVTTSDAPQPSGDGSLTSVWHLAANTVLVALATCATIIFGCCCSVFVALSWRGRRRRKGRYRTNLRGKRGSMRLIKYVIVRESS